MCKELLLAASLVFGVVLVGKVHADSDHKHHHGGKHCGHGDSRGPKGDKGDKGDAGAKGETGDTGATGPTGANGKDGVSDRPKTAWLLQPEVRFISDKYVDVSLFTAYNIREGHMFMTGLRAYFKVGKSYEEKVLDRKIDELRVLAFTLEERIKVLQMRTRDVSANRYRIDEKGGVGKSTKKARDFEILKDLR